MSRVNITDVVVLDNPAPFTNPYQFEITFDCLEDLQEDLEWKVTYVGSAESEEYDQVLDTVLVGPLPAGTHKFVFQTDAPAHQKIPVNDLVGVTVVLLTCAYRGQEFIRVGYFVNVEYLDQELRENPPTNEAIISKLQRNILATQPRVTRFHINWSGEADVGAVSEPATVSDSFTGPAVPCFKEPMDTSPGKSNGTQTNGTDLIHHSSLLGSSSTDMPMQVA